MNDQDQLTGTIDCNSQRSVVQLYAETVVPNKQRRQAVKIQLRSLIVAEEANITQEYCNQTVICNTGTGRIRATRRGQDQDQDIELQDQDQRVQLYIQGHGVEQNKLSYHTDVVADYIRFDRLCKEPDVQHQQLAVDLFR